MGKEAVLLLKFGVIDDGDGDEDDDVDDIMGICPVPAALLVNMEPPPYEVVLRDG